MNQGTENNNLLAGIIRKNHFGLYQNIADSCGLNHHHFDGYSALMAKKSEWPKMIYNVQCGDIEICLDQITGKIKNREFPHFLIVDTFSKKPDFDALAKRNGFRPVMRWPGMIRELKDPMQYNSLSGLEFRIVENENRLAQWIRIVNTNLFTNEGLDTDEFASLLRNQEIQFILGEYDKNPCATMLVHYHGNSAGIYCASTLPEYSGKGIMRNFVDRVVFNASNSGYSYAILEANAASFSLYSKAGFREVCNFDIYWKI